MVRRPSPFKQTDVTRALNGARKAGAEVAKVEIDKDGKIVMVFANGTPDPAKPEANPWHE